LALSLAGFAAGGVAYTLHLGRALHDAEQARGEAVASRGGQEAEGYLLRIALARREIAEGQGLRAWQRLDACPPPRRGWEWRYLDRLALGGERFRLYGHLYSVNDVAFRPDGGRLATAASDGLIKVWDAETGQELCTCRGHQIDVRSVAW